MLNLREICTMAIEEISGIAVPSSFAGNQSLTAKLAFRLATRAGRHLALNFRWNALRAEHVFSTEAGTADYDLPTGFHVFAHLTHWDNTNLETVKGPVSAAYWSALRRGDLIVSAFRKNFFITGSQMSIWPVPTAVEEISYFYYSKLWVDPNGAGVGSLERFENDADESLIDADLISLDLKWRFRKSKGLDFEAEKYEADNLRDSLLVSDGGGVDVLDFTGQSLSYELGGNIPDRGAGL